MSATGVGSGSTRASRRGRWTAAPLLLALAWSLTPAPAHAAPTRVPGIDVSANQGSIDWPTVATTNLRFVIIRATRGDFAAGDPPVVQAEDTRYAEYLAGASANGFVVGAYHRANADRGAGDALDEADFFVDHARIEAGDVLPVLDIEERHGLTVDELQTWVQTWVRRVSATTGVKPLVYTSPYFWYDDMGDTTWFAAHGYPLWIADWRGNPEPEVPALDWMGHGWTYWQWTVAEPGSVPGITTAIDRDRFVGTNLAHGRVASVSIAAADGGIVVGPRIRCGGAFTRCSRLGNPDTVVTLEAVPDPGAVVLGWTGACAGAGTAPACDVPMLGTKTASAVFGYPLHVDLDGTGGGLVTSSPAGIACGDGCDATFPAGSTVTLAADPDSASVFDGWAGGCSGGVPTCDVEVGAETTVTATFASTLTVEETDPGTSYAWGHANETRAIGGSYRWERRAGASVAFDVSGGIATLYTIAGPAMGRAEVLVDGEVIATFDGYAPVREPRRYRFDGLGPGPHELRVHVLGTKRPASDGTRVTVDAIRWGGVTRPDPAGPAAWGTRVDAAASGGAAAITDVPGATVRLRFTGTGVSVRLARGPSMGKAELRIDGSIVRVVDLYGTAPGYRTIDVATGLTDGRHTATVVVLGVHRPAANGDAVALDRWVVR